MTIGQQNLKQSSVVAKLSVKYVGLEKKPYLGYIIGERFSVYKVTKKYPKNGLSAPL